MSINWVVIAQAVAALLYAWHLYRKERNGMANEKTIAIVGKGGESYVTFKELTTHCKDAHGGIVRDHEKDLEHLKELIGKDLEHGRRKFDEFGKKLEQFESFLLNKKG